jgi:4-amino-4-deoxy-L-arabinose transferase-like glycosyltransferase
MSADSSTAPVGLAPRGERSALGLAAKSASRAVAAIPRAGLACALVALLNGLAWSLIIPPFEVPDENAHYAYVQQVAERGTLPRQIAPEGQLSPAEDATLAALDFYQMIGEIRNPVPFTEIQQREIERAMRKHPGTVGDGDALTATNNPPLYYTLEAVPYKIAAGGTVLDRLTLMRALSALMGAVTILLVFMFLHELLPRRPWAWSAGALVAAFQPLFGFMSGGVNNDDLLYLTAAGCLWAIARAFRRGLSPVTGAMLGGFLGAGLVSKLTLLGFVPAVVLAVVVLLWQKWSSDRRTAAKGAAWALGLAAAPIAIYGALSHFVWKRSTVSGGVGGVPAAMGRHFNFKQELSHIWQLFLPRLWLHPQFSYFPYWKTWFKGLVGRLGWLDYELPSWVFPVAAVLAGVVIVLAISELVRRRGSLRARMWELLVYLAAVAGLCMVIGVQSYRDYIQSGQVFEQPRYLLPLLGLYAGVVALAVRFGGRRWGPMLAAGIVVIAIGHDLYAQMITVARYYT